MNKFPRTIWGCLAGVALATSACAGAAGDAGDESEPVESSSPALVGGNWKGPYSGGNTSSNPVKAGSHVICEASVCVNRNCSVYAWFSGWLDGGGCRFNNGYLSGYNAPYYVSQQPAQQFYWQGKYSSTPPTVAATNSAGYPICMPTADTDAAGYVSGGQCLYVSTSGTHTIQSTTSFNWLVQSIL